MDSYPTHQNLELVSTPEKRSGELEISQPEIEAACVNFKGKTMSDQANLKSQAPMENGLSKQACFFVLASVSRIVTHLGACIP